LKRLIGLTGHKGAGKDAVAEILAAEYDFTRVAFADPLKRIATAIGWDGSKEERPPCPHCGMHQGRGLLQILGTEGVRQNIRDDAWILAAEAEIARHEKVVVTDVRFLNEARAIKNLYGQIWRVVRPGHDGDAHPSEREQDEILADRTIFNDRSLADLPTRIEWVSRWS
jgi:hypothetical protein